MSEANYATPGYFDALYARDPDPWRFATSDYERGKYAATMAALTRPRFTRGFEVGCSIGVLTSQLAKRCDELLAVDIAVGAVKQAEERCSGQDWVRLATMDLRTEWPDGQFDLILFSEVLYYLGIAGIRSAAERTLASLEPGGAVVLVNWHGPTDGACTGDEAAETFITACSPRLTTVSQSRAEQYRLDVLS